MIKHGRKSIRGETNPSTSGGGRTLLVTWPGGEVDRYQLPDGLSDDDAERDRRSKGLVSEEFNALLTSGLWERLSHKEKARAWLIGYALDHGMSSAELLYETSKRLDRLVCDLKELNGAEIATMVARLTTLVDEGRLGQRYGDGGDARVQKK